MDAIVLKSAGLCVDSVRHYTPGSRNLYIHLNIYLNFYLWHDLAIAHTWGVSHGKPVN